LGYLHCVELQEEVERLRAELMSINNVSGSLLDRFPIGENDNDESKDRVIQVLQEKLRQNEKYIADLNNIWEEKLKEAHFTPFEKKVFFFLKRKKQLIS
jgi:cytochrome c556